MNMLMNRRLVSLGMTLAVMLAAVSAEAQIVYDPVDMVGPTECAECHKKENELWQKSHHFKTFHEMPRQKEAKEIARKMGIRRIKREALCLDCHFTVLIDDKDRRRPVAGISCESCHSVGVDYIKVHSGFSDKEEKDETPEERIARWNTSDAAGMIRPSEVYDWAANCYACHVISQEELVNKGGHPTGDKFELVAWSQGTVRHNVWYNDGVANAEAKLDTRRKIFIVGMLVELEASLRALGKATKRADYAVATAKRADRARERLAQAAKVLPDIPELAVAVAAAAEAQLKLNNEAPLSAIADRIADAARKLSDNYDGGSFGGIDQALPSSDRYMGTVGTPSG